MAAHAKSGKHRRQQRDHEPPRIGRSVAGVVKMQDIAGNLGLNIKPLAGDPGRVWAIVVHADLENSITVPLIMLNPGFRKEHGIRHDAVLVLTVSGMPRASDWPDIPKKDLTGDVLEKKYGILYLDSGGGRFDQHVHPENREGSKLASIDLVANHESVREGDDFMMPVVRVIARQDLNGEAVGEDAGYKQSATPHTPRLLTNILKGWRLLAATRGMTPERMVRNWFLNFLAIRANVVHEFEHLEQDALEIAAGTYNPKAMQLLHRDKLIAGVRAYLAEESGLHPVEAARSAREYERDCDQALAVWEEEWRLGEREYQTPNVMRGIHFPAEIAAFKPHMSQEMEPEPVPRAVVMLTAAGATSLRTGGVIRHRGMRSLALPREYPPLREIIAHVVRPNGGWTIAAQRANLREAVAAIRAAEVMAAGGTLLPEYDIRAIGNFFYHDAQGRTIEGPYLPLFQTAGGTNFDTRPNEIPPGRLTPVERDRVVLRVLQQLPPTHADRFACTDAQDPLCAREECPLFRHNFAGCGEFRRLEAAGGVAPAAPLAAEAATEASSEPEEPASDESGGWSTEI